jgi:hypothetical protein
MHLRQADWRFLLPATSRTRFEHLVLLGGSAALADRIVGLGVARRASIDLPRRELVDAVIMLAPAREPVDAAAQQLVDGGVLYCEIDRRSPGRLMWTPRRLASRMRTLGMQIGSTYCINPGILSPDTYLPDDNRAFEWYLGALYRGSTAPRRVLRTTARAVAAAGVSLRALAPVHAITAVRGSAPALPAIVDTARTVLGWHGRDVSAAMLAHGDAESNRIVLLLFDRGRQPSAVAKFARIPRFNPPVEREHRYLVEIRRALVPDLRETVPASALSACGELAVAVQTCVPGSTLRSRIGERRHHLLADLRLVTDWLVRFGRATTIDTPPAREWFAQRLVSGLCAEYAGRFGLTAAERRLFGAVNAHVASLGSGRLPIIWQHADFGPWNIYRSGSRLSVIDWELGRHGPALADLIFFAIHWSAEATGVVDSEEAAAHFETLFDAGGSAHPLAAPIDDAIATYMRALDLPGELLPLMLVYTVLERALLHATRFPAADATPAALRAGNRHVGYLDALARRTSRFFPAEAARAA